MSAQPHLSLAIVPVVLLFRVIVPEAMHIDSICKPTGYTPYDYPQALCMSLLFYEAQRSGKLPPDQRVSWREDSALNDGMDNNVALDGGYYDGGDYVKFLFPMAFTITALAWGLLSYPHGFKIAGETENVKTAIKWGAQYILKAKTGPTELWVQVGDPVLDHSYWGRPEDMDIERPSYKVDSLNPGSDVAGEAAAALAATYIIFKKSDPVFASLALDSAKELFNFADLYRGRYQISVPKAKGYYDSFSYGDELAWSALWLYKATEDEVYLTKAEELINEFGILNYAKNFDWDAKNPGIYVLLAEISENKTFENLLETCINNLISKGQYTPKGMLYISRWGSLRLAMNSAFVAMKAASLGIHTSSYQAWAQTQLDYALGSSGRSFVVGFGINPPKQNHHRASSCPDTPTVCNFSHLSNPSPNFKVLYGALVGGPDEKDHYVDNRRDFVHNEVSCDYNALFTGLLSAMIEVQTFSAINSDAE